MKYLFWIKIFCISWIWELPKQLKWICIEDLKSKSTESFHPKAVEVTPLLCVLSDYMLSISCLSHYIGWWDSQIMLTALYFKKLRCLLLNIVLQGRMILAHLCDEPKGLKTHMCMVQTHFSYIAVLHWVLIMIWSISWVLWNSMLTLVALEPVQEGLWIIGLLTKYFASILVLRKLLKVARRINCNSLIQIFTLRRTNIWLGITTESAHLISFCSASYWHSAQWFPLASISYSC